MAIKVYPYKAGSRSARALADALGARVLRKEGSRYVRRENDLIINWGASDCPYGGRGVANQPEAVKEASNKLTFLIKLKEAGVSIPDFFTRMEDIPNEAFPVMCRTILTGHSGAGIVLANNRNDVVHAPLYVRYVKKKEEYRVHCLREPGGPVSIIMCQRKARRNGFDNADYKVRNLANGFVYVIDNEHNVPDDVLEQATKALETSGLAFGAVDVIWNEHQQKAYVLEINSAPGLEERTANAYAEKFKEIYRGM